MKKKIIGSFAVLAIVALAACNVYFNNEKEQLSALALANIEALASGESGGGYGCGYAAYEWDDDWYEDNKNFTKCKSGCPEGSGISPRYVNC